MKYSEVWSKLLTQNLTLRTTIVVLSVCLLYLGGVIVYQAARDPIVIERSCYTKAIQTGSSKHSEDEIKTFIELSLAQRFNSDKEPYADYLSEDMRAKVESEKEELLKNGMRQKIIINEMKIENDVVQVDADRLISVKHIRSAFPFPLTIKINSVPRNEANSYGLQVIDIIAQKVIDGKDGKND